MDKKMKITVLALLLALIVMTLSGCLFDRNTRDPSNEADHGGGGSQTQGPSASGGSAKSYQDSLMDRIPFSVDLGPGWEFRDLTVNGEFRRIAVQFEMDSSVIDQDPCFTYYYVDIHGETLSAEVVAVGRAFFNDSTTQYVRGCKAADDLGGISFELFEGDFKASVFKGKDKEYIVFSIPSGWDPDTSTLVIATDKGRLLADAVVDKSHQVTLQGDDDDDDMGKYTDAYGNANFFSFSEDSVTYLKVSQRVDGVTYLTEYSLTIENDRITSKETGKTYQTTDTVPDLPGLTVY